MNERSGNRPVVFGEVLFDRFPDGSTVLGGAPFNVAWNLRAFGEDPVFVSRVGDDPLGEGIRALMLGWGMDTSWLQTDPVHATGIVDVSFRDGEPSYEIVESRAYDFLERGPFGALGDAALIYHGSLALRSNVTRAAFDALVSRVRVPRFLDVNLRAPYWERQEVLGLIANADWVKLNEDELALLAPAAGLKSDAAAAFRERYGLSALIVTRGKLGAQLVRADMTARVAPGDASPVVDSVGAGDAFASVMLLGLLEEWPVETALERAQAFASAVVGVRGATVNDPAFYAPFRGAWGFKSGN